MEKEVRGIDVIGTIAVLKFNRDCSNARKKEIAASLLKEKPPLKTIVEKIEKVSGRLRTIKTDFLAGVNTKETVHRENGCLFKLNIDTCYFSPRLSNERQLIAEEVGKKDSVLVMFSGVGVYPIVIYKNSKPKKIVSIELGKECCRYAVINDVLNKIPVGKIEVVQGDVKKKVTKKLGKFDVVVMARPNLKETFLKEGLLACKRGSKLFYYAFCADEKIRDEVLRLEKEAKKYKRKIKVGKIVNSGEIAPYSHRFRIEMKVGN